MLGVTRPAFVKSQWCQPCRSQQDLYQARVHGKERYNAGMLRDATIAQGCLASLTDLTAVEGGKILDDVWEIPRLTGTCAERIPEFPTQLPLELLRQAWPRSNQAGSTSGLRRISGSTSFRCCG